MATSPAGSPGSPDELPRIKSLVSVAGKPAGLAHHLLFVDKSYRHKGVAAAALNGTVRDHKPGSAEAPRESLSREDVEDAASRICSSTNFATLAMFELAAPSVPANFGKNSGWHQDGGAKRTAGADPALTIR